MPILPESKYFTFVTEIFRNTIYNGTADKSVTMELLLGSTTMPYMFLCEKKLKAAVIKHRFIILKFSLSLPHPLCFFNLQGENQLEEDNLAK